MRAERTGTGRIAPNRRSRPPARAKEQTPGVIADTGAAAHAARLGGHILIQGETSDMRIPAKRAIALPAALLSAVALTGVVAGTADAAVVSSGSVTLSVNASFVSQLAKHGIGLLPQDYSSISCANGQVSITYAATGGDADISTFSGSVSYAGAILGFDVKNGKSVNLGSLLFDLSNDQFDGQTATSGGEVPLLDLGGTQAGNINGSTETYSASDLTLDQAGADYVNSALGTTAFVSGESVGSFSTTWVI